jgi:hypothetical protein
MKRDLERPPKFGLTFNSARLMVVLAFHSTQSAAREVAERRCPPTGR